MLKIKFISKFFVIIIFTIILINCTSSDENSDSFSVNLGEFKGNLLSEKLFVTLSNDESSLSKKNRSLGIYRNSKKEKSNTTSLITIDDNGDFDYGIVSQHPIIVDQLVNIDLNRSFAFLDFDDHYTWQVINGLKCGIFYFKNQSSNPNCPVIGVYPITLKSNYEFDAETYGVNPVQIANSSIFFRSMHSESSISENLKCPGSCVYKFDLKSQSLERISDTKISVEKFIALGDGDVVYRGIYPDKFEENGGNTASLLNYQKTDGSGVKFEIPNSGGGELSGDYKTLIWAGGGAGGPNLTLYRFEENSHKYGYINISHELLGSFKGDDGVIYGQSKDSLYSLIPNISLPIVSIPNHIDVLGIQKCGFSLTCNTYFKVINGIVFSSYIDFNKVKRPTVISAKRISDNATLNILESSSDCSENCYRVDINCDEIICASYPKWSQKNGILYVPAKNLNNKNNLLLKVDVSGIDFSGNKNQFSIIDGEGFTGKSINNISNIEKIKANNTVELKFKYLDSNRSSIQIIFNNGMDHKTTELKLKVIKTSDDSNVDFIPIWNGKSLHLVFDTVLSRGQDNTPNPLSLGETYRVTVLKGAKDLNGNILSSDQYFDIKI